MNYRNVSPIQKTSQEHTNLRVVTQSSTTEVTGLCFESLILVGFCVADAISTLILVSMGIATEFNPVMAFFLNQGATAFLVAKILSFAPFIVVCEIYRRREPGRARAVIRWAAISYIGLYVVMLFLVNTGRI